MRKQKVKVFKYIINSILLISSLVVLSTKPVYAHLFNKITVGEITLNSKSGNPMDYVANYINEEGHIDGSIFDVISASEDEYETQLEEKIYINGKQINENIQNMNFSNSLFSIKDLIIICFILLVFALSIYYIIKGKYKKAIFLGVVVIALSICEVIGYTKSKRDDYIISYLNNGIMNSNISNKIEKDFGDSFIDKMCDRRYGIGMSVNDFIVKCFYAVKCRANNEKVYKDNLDHKYLWGTDVDELHYSYADKLSQLDNSAYEYDGEGSYGASVSYSKIKELYNKISDEDIEDFNKGIYLDKLVTKLEKVLKHSSNNELINNNEKVIDYLGRLGAMYFWNGNIETEVLRYFKDWYIDGEDRIVELPYDYYLTYKKEQFIKRDIKKFIKSNIDDFDIETANGEGIIVYYNDSNNNIKGDFVILQMIEEDGKSKLYFNKTQLLYDIRKPVTIITLNDKIQFVDEKPIMFYDELYKYVVSDEYIEEENKNDEKDYYSDGVTEKMYNNDGVLLTNWKDKSEKIEEIVVNDELVSKSFGTKRDWQLTRLLTFRGFDNVKAVRDSYEYTKRFVKKYSNISKIMGKYNDCEIEDVPINFSIAKTDKVIKKLILKDTREEKYCIFNVHWTEDGMIDDIEYYIVPDDKMNLSYEEMYKLAFND